jgi:hypothetical protein
MTKKLSMANSTGQGWFSDAIGGAWRLVKHGTKIHNAGNSPFYDELCALSAEHMAILVHKRSRYLGAPDDRMNLRWFTELDDFVTHTIWPRLFEASMAGVNSKSDIIEVLDGIIGAEQRRIAAKKAADDIPHTSRFDTSWAN